MKKLFVLVAGVAALGLSSCKSSCPAYGNHASAVHKSAPVTASAAAPAAQL